MSHTNVVIKLAGLQVRLHVEKEKGIDKEDIFMRRLIL
jgi:hypothetical protein